MNIPWSEISALATAAAAVAAFISAYFSWRATQAALISGREARASQSLLQYVDLNLKYPRHSTSSAGQRYQWFVFGVLTMAQEVLAAYPGNKRWRTQIRQQLSFHWRELKHWPANEIENFGDEVTALVREVVKKKGAL